MRRFFVLATFCLLISFSFAQKRIISLAPSLTQNLFLLGAENNVVGYTNYCEKAVHGGKSIIATAVKVNLEKVITLKPDYIIATTITNPETIKQLQNFGIEVDVYKTPQTFDEICSQFITIGNKIGKGDAAQRIVSKSKAMTDSIRQKMEREPVRKMFFQIGSNPLYCVPPKSFMHDYMGFLNGENIHTVVGNGSISREGVVVRNPDVIFVTTMGIMGEKEAEIWRGYGEVTASKKNQIFVLDANKSCSPTPITFVETLETMANYLLE